MIALREEGKIASIGLSNVTLAQLRQAIPAGLACVQNSYNLLDRSSEVLLDECRVHDIAWVPFFPLGSAFSMMPSVAEDLAVVEAAEKLGALPAQVGLAWLLAHAPQALLVPGTTNPDHLVQNIAAADVHLGSDAMATLSRSNESSARTMRQT